MKTRQITSFDAIVIGSGISGGWAAKELTEKGLKTLILERGRSLEHIKDYPTTNSAPWEFNYRGEVSPEIKKDYLIQSTNYSFNDATKHFFVKDTENPYVNPENKEFRWIRGYHTGGRSLMWARQCYRWSDLDFEANAKEGIEIDWPIRYKDIAPWYDYVEKFAGISGQAEGLPQLPDGQFLPPMEMNCVEKYVKEKIQETWPDRTMTIGRVAHLTVPHNGRGKCMYRNLCYRGCPFGAYFSSQSATLPAATATGNMTLRPNSIVHSILYDEQKDKATGVRVIDGETLETLEFSARIIFLCASTLGSTQILLNSTSNRFPQGLANSSGVLGHYLMDHHTDVDSKARFDGFENEYYNGHRPNGIYVPRFRNVKTKHPDFLRGYGMQGSGSREGWSRGNDIDDLGADFKKAITEPGPWTMSFGGFGECLPYYDNKVELNPDLKDKWGLPTLRISCEFKENELAMRKDMAITSAELLEAAGGKDIETTNEKAIPGFAIHEMGTARMGNDPKTSVLNKWNQCHDVPNLFVTDGSCMTSSACQNPSITYMALTARACDYAVKELNRRNL
ncbi:MAG: GMC family oxidoreductase [Bacteroidetes bacterium]|nr:GMC family oxidoreductase [Bacteroidota bacterium]